MFKQTLYYSSKKFTEQYQFFITKSPKSRLASFKARRIKTKTHDAFSQKATEARNLKGQLNREKPETALKKGKSVGQINHPPTRPPILTSCARRKSFLPNYQRNSFRSDISQTTITQNGEYGQHQKDQNKCKHMNLTN